MQKLLDLLNELSVKYKFSEEDVKRIQETVFSLEAPDGSEDADMAAEDFMDPNAPVGEIEEAYG